VEDGALLISDVDGTLLGDDEALREFAAWCESRREWLRLVYNSGRLFESVRESIETTDLPVPDAIIGGVGTQVRGFRSNAPLGDWPDDREGWQPLRVCSVMGEYDEVELQPAEFLSDYKLSFFVHDASPELIEEFRRRLAEASCRVELVYSSNRDLDVLPHGANKGSAAAHLASQWSFARDRVFVSGDSGNDLAMFTQGFRGIVVGNAHRELKRLDSSSVFHSNRPYAAGVLHGLSYWLGSHSSDAESPAHQHSNTF